jgi:glutamate dehydrogenase (NAD(P)+)
MGGSLGRTEATGYGVIYTLREAMKALGLEFQGATASVQGAGNVAQHAIDLFTRLGGKVIAVACWDNTDHKAYTYRCLGGISFEDLRSTLDRFGTIAPAKAKALGWEQLDGEAWIEQEVTVLIPAALDGSVRKENAGRIHESVKILAEGANGPTTLEADAIIQARGLFVIPDFLCNAGGVTCSYFEQVQSNANDYWDRDLVFEKLDRKMTQAFRAVLELSRKRGISMRDAAYMIAVSRVAEACKLRGWV